MAKCGKQCEVFTRVVGFFRPLRWFNRGKKEEHKDRKQFVIPKTKDMPDVNSPEKRSPKS